MELQAADDQDRKTIPFPGSSPNPSPQGTHSRRKTSSELENPPEDSPNGLAEETEHLRPERQDIRILPEKLTPMSCSQG
ncbi:hypothetical protein CDL15_Pgr023168 [Punica granatum]|uniref:Uncharacterized protein n=1 Tax=Punica granatum TaxID=22663 RepID=A0A218X4X9_PUNGR|nr:hypothetical protein CDL15_Pgr023168 [Punica granatum]